MLAAALCTTACDNSKKTAEQQKPNTETTATNPTENVNSNQNPSTIMPDSATMAKAMAAWEDFAKPGAEHAWMATQTGT